MVLYADKRFITNSEHPNDELYPNFDFVFDDDGNISDVVEIEPPPAPEPAPTDHERLEALEQAFMGFVSEVM